MIKEETVQALKEYVRAANYLTVTQLYLKDNYLLTKRLLPADIKDRLLGHWGTCPGINFVYANLNYFITQNKKQVIFILGSGHGFPALQANLFLEKTLEQFYPQANHTPDGIGYISKYFSWPYGFPSHSWPGCPGTILEGGELGYALATAYGSVIGNPDLITACLIGDGEAETGTTATSWHLNKFINPKDDGAVLPILHLNEYKISGPTIFGRMPEKSLKALFRGYGYKPIIVKGPNIYQKMIKSLESAHELIKKIKKGKLDITQDSPLIILKTPKGWTGPKSVDGKKIENNNLSHQIVAKNCKTDLSELQIINQWLKSYKFNDLFDLKTGFNKKIWSIIPEQNLRMGLNTHAYSAKQIIPLSLKALKNFTVNTICPGQTSASPMKTIGKYLENVFKNNKNIRLFSPDEIYSNKLDAVLKSTTRVFNLEKKPWDTDIENHGQVIEMLSENALQGLAQGYALTGRHSIIASYEAFLDIISSMAHQYAKFIFQALSYKWRKDIPSLNYILTSSGWRQEHNGYSHQNPGFVSSLLNTQYGFVKAFYPPDANSTLAALKRSLEKNNTINMITSDKRESLNWLEIDKAEEYCSRGISIWDFASSPNPDFIFAAAGDHMTTEALGAISLLKAEFKELKFRFVNISVINGEGIGYEGDLGDKEFCDYFTSDKPVIINFHGYPSLIKSLIFNKPNSHRFKVFGYIEKGSTTTPFDMLTRNKTDRYNLAINAIETLIKEGKIEYYKGQKIINLYRKILEEHQSYIFEFGIDPAPITNWKWKNTF